MDWLIVKDFSYFMNVEKSELCLSDNAGSVLATCSLPCHPRRQLAEIYSSLWSSTPVVSGDPSAVNSR